MQSVMNDSRVSKYPVYLLDTTTGKTIKGIMSIIEQVADSTKPSILYIPEIENLYNAVTKHTKEECGSVLISKLQQLRGPSQMLVATCGSNIKDYSLELSSLFNQNASFKLRTPTDAEREEFFKQLFRDDLKLGSAWEKDFVQKCVGATVADSIKSITTFFGDLLNAQLDSNGESDKIKTSMVQVLKVFESSE